MTACAQCLSELSTMRMTDMRAGSQVALHCQSCPGCAGVAHEIAYAERRLATALSEARSGFTPEQLSFSALDRSEWLRRRQIGKWISGFLAIAGCVTFWFFMQDVFIPRVDPGKTLPIQTVTLRCLTSEQASELATPYLRANGSAIYQTKGFKAITIRGQAKEALEASMKIRELDDAARCGIADPPATAQKATTPTSNDIPKKD